MPEPPVVSVGTGVEQQPGGLQCGRQLDVGVVAGVRLVQQWRPAVRPAGNACRSLPPGQLTAHLRHRAARSRHEQVVAGQIGVIGQELGGGRTVGRLVDAVGKARQSKEPVGQRFVVRYRLPRAYARAVTTST